jgi:hypothetical protein
MDNNKNSANSNGSPVSNNEEPSCAEDRLALSEQRIQDTRYLVEQTIHRLQTSYLSAIGDSVIGHS